MNKGWMKLSAGVVFLASSVASFGGEGVAEPLPKNAKPLSSAEVRAMYSDKSVIWGYKDGAYFASNGKAFGVYTNWHTDNNPRQKWTGYMSGTWSASGNQMCWRYGGYDLTDKKAFSGGSLCWKWYRSGSKYYVIQTKKPRGKSPSGINDYYADELSKHRNGDRISGWFSEYKKRAKSS